MTHRFATLDVFTERRLSGNPLAVVLGADDLDARAMQAIAAEFNLSETVFVSAPADARHRAALRIFTPSRELPFAGHPTVGAAVLLALEDGPGDEPRAIVLEEGAGLVPCVVAVSSEGGHARFTAPTLPTHLGAGPEAALLAALLGLAPDDIGFGRHVPSRHGVGPSFTCVPVASVERLDRARPAQAPQPDDGLYLYAPDPDGGTEGPGRRWHARMFAPNFGVPEDPATGAAAVAFAGVLMRFEVLGDGVHDVVIRQGWAMGRPSEIALRLAIEAGRLRAVEIGGAAVVVSEGRLRV